MVVHCHNVCRIHDKDTKLTSVFLKMSPILSWNSQGSLYRRSDLGLYDTLMAAMVVAGRVS